MLDEVEYGAIAQLYSDSMRSSKEFREKHNLPLSEMTMDERFSPVCEAYFKMTGFRETVANAIMHHRISLYGSPCTACGKPLRSPKASFCAACGRRP